MVLPAVARIRPFSSRLWILGSAALGFAAGVMLAVLVWVALMIALAPSGAIWFRHEIALFIGIAIIALPALGQRRLLARSGLECGGYFTTTMLGGWLTWCVPILAIGRVELIERLQHIDEIDIGIVLAGAALLCGGLVAGWLQGWAMPPPLRSLWLRIAPLAALVAAFAGASVALLFALATWDLPWVVRDPILGGLALATGWCVFASLTAWPIRHALSLMHLDAAPAREPVPASPSPTPVAEPVAAMPAIAVAAAPEPVIEPVPAAAIPAVAAAEPAAG